MFGHAARWSSIRFPPGSLRRITPSKAGFGNQRSSSGTCRRQFFDSEHPAAMLRGVLFSVEKGFALRRHCGILTVLIGNHIPMRIERLILITFLGNYLINNVVAAIVALLPLSGNTTAQYVIYFVLAA